MEPTEINLHKYQALFTIGLIILYVWFLFLLVNSFVYYENLVKCVK